MKLVFHAGTDMNQAMAEVVGVRQPGASVYAARRGTAVHNAVRCGQRTRGTTRVLESDRVRRVRCRISR